MTGDEREREAIRAEVHDVLLNAEARPGGPVGIVAERYEDAVMTAMRAVGWITSDGLLTKRGAGRALAVQDEEWG